MSAPVSLTHDEIMARAEKAIALGETAPRAGRDPVNQPMINNWVEAIGDANPLWHTGVAPPAMAQVWTMYGLDPARPADDPLHGTMQMLDEAGFTSVLGTNADQTYARSLRIGEEVTITSRLESVVGPKRTGVGEGYFVTTQNTWRVALPDGGSEVVATMAFRVLKFRPAPPASSGVADPARTVRPAVNRDSAYFWEGTAHGELRIQTCNPCGVLRHPPGPVCPSCHAMDRGYVVASGRGTVHSWLVHHSPAVPGKKLPLRLALVELEEGVRMVGEVQGVVGIGDAVEATYNRIDDELTLAQWRSPTGKVAEHAEVEEVAQQPPSLDDSLPGWELPITRTLVVSTALATRDFQDVHHDPELAVLRGTKDIFLNILTTTGLVQRYVTERVGGNARVASCALRLGAPAYPGDTLVLTGTVTAQDDRTMTVDVVGAVSLGNHVTATVALELA